MLENGSAHPLELPALDQLLHVAAQHARAVSVQVDKALANLDGAGQLQLRTGRRVQPADEQSQSSLH